MVLTFSDLSVGYRQRFEPAVIASGLDGGVESNSLTCLLGANGSGKSTLIRTIAGLQPSLGGAVSIAGVDPASAPPRQLATVMALVLSQRINSGTMTVTDMVSLGRYPHTGWSGRLSENDRGVVAEALETMAATDMTNRRISELSDGEYQRVAVARALAQKPKLLVLDEPTAHLDIPQRLRLITGLRDLARSHGIGVLMSTHEIDLALRVADHLFVMHEGTMAIGSPESLGMTGVVQRAFPSEGLHFDATEGTFVPNAESSVTVGVTADAASAPWIRRSVMRNGFRPAFGDDAAITVVEDDRGFLVRAAQYERRAGDIEALGDVLSDLRIRYEESDCHD